MPAQPHRHPSTPPDVAHRLDARALQALLPHVPTGDLDDVRTAFAVHLDNAQRRPVSSRPAHAQGESVQAAANETWQDAWNVWTGAHPGPPARPGRLTYTPSRCPQCHGKGFDVRRIAANLARTGSPHTCGTCRGRRRGTPTTVVALPAAETANTR